MQSISPKLLEKLIAAGFTSLESLSWIEPQELTEQIDLNFEEATKIVEEAKASLNYKPMTAVELLEKEKTKKPITTGSKELDNLLGGGIYTGEITELSGAFGTGKTQLCFQLCLNVQLPQSEGGLSGGAYYIDTEASFSSKRIAQMAQSNGLDPLKYLKNIAVTKTHNSDHLMYIIRNVDKIIKKRNIRLFVIDSIASHFRAEYTGEVNLVKRQQVVMSLAETLKKLLETYDLAIVVTNQVIATIDETLLDKSPHPALGFAWAHRPHQRILLRKGRGSSRIARMYDSSRLPDRECVFFVTEKGITDK